MSSNKSKAHHQARDDAWGPKKDGKRPGKNPFSTRDKQKGEELTKRIHDRAGKGK